MSKQILARLQRHTYCAGISWCWLVVLILYCAVAWGADQTPHLAPRETPGDPQKDASFPKIIIDEKVFDFKTIYEGEPIVHTFTIKNMGNGALVIEKVKPS